MRKWVATILLVRLACLEASPASAPDELRAGLVWLRFHSSNFERPHDMGAAQTVDMDTGETINDFSQTWTGYLWIPTDSPITFSAEVDNGCRLFLQDVLVVDAWDGAREAVYQGEKDARVPLRLDYFQNGGSGHIRLFWEWEGHTRELIPPAAFFHTMAQRKLAEQTLGVTAETREDRSVIYQPNQGIPGRAPEVEQPVPATPGPHLLIDDYLIAAGDDVERVVVQPQRDPAIPNPIVNAADDHSFQPYLTVLRDPETQRFRIWYGAFRDDKRADRSQLATMASADGIHFERPHTVCDTPEIQFGSEVIDRGPEYSDPAARYVYSYWLGGGMRLLASADGIAWKPLVGGVVLPHDHDITGVDRDPLREKYVATISTYTTGAAWTGQRRTTMMSVSDDLVHWEEPWYILTASDELDEGETQFYAMDGYLTRGPLRIGMVKILRDDLRATETEDGSFGRAHTSLAWSRDGRTWVRDREKFFEPDDDPKAWDHAHAWVDEQVIVDNEVYLYYGGYKQGHKMNRFEERQIGLVHMALDRYVARRATGAAPGMLRTVPFRLDANGTALTLNAAANGHIRVQLRDATTGEVIPGFGFDDCEPVTGDGLRHAVRWGSEWLPRDAENPITLEFEMVNADLFAFTFE